MDLCKHCGFRGNLAKCSEAACNQHDNWFAQELIRLIDESSKFFSVHSFDGDKQPRTESNYSELVINDEIDKKIKNFMTDSKEQELINRFKQRRS